jgi:hypothetical protein
MCFQERENGKNENDTKRLRKQMGGERERGGEREKDG